MIPTSISPHVERERTVCARVKDCRPATPDVAFDILVRDSRFRMTAQGSLRWSFHMAQRSLGDVIRRALADGPQLIHHDTGDVVILPLEAYERLAGSEGASLGEFLRVSPLADAETERRRHAERPGSPDATPSSP